ncbi:hypothetical protein AD998_21305 [bacterium 336/3]|nr:hypothetical protein AD998_21305 [bacterium 336/3]
MKRIAIIICLYFSISIISKGQIVEIQVTNTLQSGEGSFANAVSQVNSFPVASPPVHIIFNISGNGPHYIDISNPYYVTFTKPVVIVGQSSVIIRGGIVLNYSGSTINGLNIDGTPIPNQTYWTYWSHYGIMINANDIEIKNCKISNIYAQSIFGPCFAAAPAGSNPPIVSVPCSNPPDGGTGIYIANTVLRAKIKNNTITNCQKNGIEINTPSPSLIEGIIEITGNHIYNNANNPYFFTIPHPNSGGIRGANIYPTYSFNNIIKNNGLLSEHTQWSGMGGTASISNITKSGDTYTVTGTKPVFDPYTGFQSSVQIFKIDNPSENVTNRYSVSGVLGGSPVTVGNTWSVQVPSYLLDPIVNFSDNTIYLTTISTISMLWSNVPYALYSSSYSTKFKFCVDNGLYPTVYINGNQTHPKAGEEVNFTPTVINGLSNLVYQWEVINSENNVVATSNQSIFNYSFPFAGATYTVKLTLNSIDGCGNVKQSIAIYTITTQPPICSGRYIGINPASDIGVVKNGSTGAILFSYPLVNCNASIPFDCIGEKATIKYDSIVSASASQLTTNWGEPTQEITYNPFEAGHRGRWFAQRAYTFNTPLNAKNANGTDMPNYESGTFSYIPFNWQSKSRYRPTKWLAPTEVEIYSPNGEVLQERNMLGIRSCAKFGYNGNLAYLVAKNASLQEVLFESFENTYTNGSVTTLEDNLLSNIIIVPNLTNPEEVAHSGRSSALMSGSTYTLEFNNPEANGLKMTEHIQNKGVLVKFWVKSTELLNNESSNTKYISVRVLNKSNAVITNKRVNVVAQTGEWRLCEANFVSSELSQILLKDSFKISLEKSVGFSSQIFIDDIAVQPLDSEIASYVYDPKTLRLLASLDSQHFGMYYQYNYEGKLVRKLVETERGIKTIQETQYNTPKEARP